MWVTKQKAHTDVGMGNKKIPSLAARLAWKMHHFRGLAALRPNLSASLPLALGYVCGSNCASDVPWVYINKKVTIFSLVENMGNCGINT